MLKKLIILAMLISSVYVIAPEDVFANELLENDQKQVQRELDSVQLKLTDAEVSLVELVQDLEALDSQLIVLNESVVDNTKMTVETKAEISNNESEVEELKLEIDRLEIDIEQRFELLKNRASSYQKNGGENASYIEVILGSESFGDFVSRVVTMTKIAQADHDYMEQLVINQQELEDVQLEHEEFISTLDEQVTMLEDLLAEIDDQQEEMSRVRDEMKDNEAEQEALIADLIEEEKNLASQEADIRKRIEAEVRLQEEVHRADSVARAEAERAAAQNSSSNFNNSQTVPKPSENFSSGSTEGSWETYQATAYTAYCIGCSGITRTGVDLRANPNAKVIAVDPSMIPLGSRVEVKGYGIFLAADTGGAIKGRKVDIFMPNRVDALSFGRRSVELRVLE